MNDTSIKSYDYNLPKEQIAEAPLHQRHKSRLLHLNLQNDVTIERQFCNLLEILNPNDLLILNDTRVIPARIIMTKDTGGKIELLFHRKLSDRKCEAIFSSSRVPKIGSVLSINNNVIFKVVKRVDNILTLESQLASKVFDIYEKYGEVPLPKYIKRPISNSDRRKYQTVYAKFKGSVAAPTACLLYTSPSPRDS